MISRRKILSGPRSDPHIISRFQPVEDEEDVWYQKEELYKDHIQEVLKKWTQIDDEIWAKVIVLERNRRVAKAYARAPVLTINDSVDGFDGFRIGLCGFDNPMRDQKTEEFRRHIGHGVKIKMDDAGNILIKRVSKSNIYVKHTAQDDENAVDKEILKLPKCALEPDKPVKACMRLLKLELYLLIGSPLNDWHKEEDTASMLRDYIAIIIHPDRKVDPSSLLAFIKVLLFGKDFEMYKEISVNELFDMKKFQSNVNRELRKAYPDRRRLEYQCLSAIPFVKLEPELLECPIWVLIINIVALDMLKSKLPPVQRVIDIKNRPRIPIPDEDPYSVAGTASGSSGNYGFAGGPIRSRDRLVMQSQEVAQSQSEKPPKLPPRKNLYPHDIPKPDYDDYISKHKPFASSRSKEKSKENNKYDDPYYCGLRARVPNFITKFKKMEPVPSKRVSISQQRPHGPEPNTIYLHNHMNTHSKHSRSAPWHSKNYENEIDSDPVTESPYNHIYGRLPLPPNRGYIPSQPPSMYIGRWN